MGHFGLFIIFIPFIFFIAVHALLHIFFGLHSTSSHSDSIEPLPKVGKFGVLGRSYLCRKELPFFHEDCLQRRRRPSWRSSTKCVVNTETALDSNGAVPTYDTPSKRRVPLVRIAPQRREKRSRICVPSVPRSAARAHEALRRKSGSLTIFPFGSA